MSVACVLIYGHKYSFEPIGAVAQPCPQCGGSPIELSWARKKMTMYWIPLFTIETSYAIGCAGCNNHWTISKEVGEELEKTLQW
jgi:hypothetical protein